MHPPLPHEILYEILSLALWESENPINILLVCPLFYSIGQHILYSDLRFTSTKQLQLFSQSIAISTTSTTGKNLHIPVPSAVPIAPHSITVEIAARGLNHNDGLWDALKRVLLRCIESDQDVESRVKPTEKAPRTATLQLKHLHLHFLSHTKMWELQLISETLNLVRPECFQWTGHPVVDPYSMAINQYSIPYILSPMSSWAPTLKHLKLSNIAFPDPDSSSSLLPGILARYILGLGPKPIQDFPGPQVDAEAPTVTLPLSNLHTLTISHALRLSALDVAFIAGAGAAAMTATTLERISLIDAFSGGIFSSRLTLQSIERSITQFVAQAQAQALLTLNNHSTQHHDVDRTRRLELEGLSVLDRYGIPRDEGEWVKRVRRVVRCREQTARVFGPGAIEMMRGELV